MRLSKLTVSMYLGLVFLSGIAIGAFAHRLYTVSTVSATAPKPPDEWRKKYLDEMQSRLHLRADQFSNLNAILDETRNRFHEVKERTRPEFEAIKEQQISKIRTMLDNSQREEYQKMRQEREAREKAGQRPQGPGF